MKTLQKNLLGGLILLFSISAFAQKNQIPATVNNCNSGYSTTLLLENQIAVDENIGSISTAAPLFTIDIENSRGNSVSISNLSYSFKITNLNIGQAIDFENFDYLNEAYISDEYVISSNGNGYDVEFVSTQSSEGSTFLIDDRASLVVAEVLERSFELYRNGNLGSAQNNIGYSIEITNVRFETTGSNFLETCATNFTKTVLIELEGIQKTSPLSTASLFKMESDNLMHFFPNPAKEKVYVYLSGIENNVQNYEVHIYNTNGQILVAEKWSPNKAINLNQLNKGFYNLCILDNTRKVIYGDKLVVE